MKEYTKKLEVPGLTRNSCDLEPDILTRRNTFETASGNPVQSKNRN